MKFDVIGRINNMRLPDGKTAVLYSVYEAVSNAIHAINDRFGEDKAAEKGKVDVEIRVDDAFEIDTISITDNGIGFSEKPQRLRLASPGSPEDSEVGEEDKALVTLMRSAPVTRLIKHVDDMKALETVLAAEDETSE